LWQVISIGHKKEEELNITNPCSLCHHKRHCEYDCKYGRKKCVCLGRIRKRNEYDKGLYHLFDFKKNTKPKYHRTADLRTLTGWEYEKIHSDIRKQKPKPDKCEICHINAARQLSCKDHLYSNNPNTYQYLCNSCHFKYDLEKGYRLSAKYVEEMVRKQEYGY
jgi:hypothetical protein